MTIAAHSGIIWSQRKGNLINERKNKMTREKIRSKGKEMKKILKWLLSIFTGKSDEAVDAGICDFSGQGRDKYGR